ncbi:MAG: hypothetical protein HETSPECPRED_006259 [Heterodermia speciosa]|uniref:Uncharacterized protein n=1 Tax=Heterodermia speciosa TaxID=116794 RepID=A0A8H3FMJ4_9LECA|nr:MAG: hypothetical protein HETSPECPRED_006259 [Heterodermia speciosa]
MFVPSLISIPICLLAFISSAVASPAASPTPVPVCNNDNCNRALRASISAASSFCATYTTSTVTATTGIPTYIPSTCGPSRISSACTCVVTKSACAFNAPTQVVQDPGFEATPDPKVSDSVHSGAGTPWLATDTTGDDFFVQGDGYSGPGFWHVWGYGSDFHGLTGTATLTQTLNFCTTSKYAFSAYVGYAGQGPFNTTITVYLGNSVLIPTQKTCKDEADCALPTNPKDPQGGYRHLVADIPSPPPSEAVLKVVIYRESSGNPPPALPDTLFDDVTITKVG